MVVLEREKIELKNKLEQINTSIFSGGYFWGYKLSLASIRYRIMLIDIEIEKLKQNEREY